MKEFKCRFCNRPNLQVGRTSYCVSCKQIFRQDLLQKELSEMRLVINGMAELETRLRLIEEELAKELKKK